MYCVYDETLTRMRRLTTLTELSTSMRDILTSTASTKLFTSVISVLTLEF